MLISGFGNKPARHDGATVAQATYATPERRACTRFLTPPSRDARRTRASRRRV
jgi:hypothetical protein